MFVELHMIQNFAPANLNRDDTNNPKDCEFGGVRRARISSQSLKRAMREESIFEEITKQPTGKRTRWIVNQLKDRLSQSGIAEEMDSILNDFMEDFGSKLDKDGRTDVLIYISPGELARISDELVIKWSDLVDIKQRKSILPKITKALKKEFEGRATAPDIALFGRMLAGKSGFNLDAACQVAHAISTHRVTMEMDFYTAVDELKPEETSGAGMMGFTGYNSACFYRYARLDWPQLLKNLGNDSALATATVRGFLQASVAAVPSAKQNSFAAHNPPSLLVGVVRQGGMGWSLANAFEKPVRPEREGGYVAPSAKALDHYWQRLTTIYGTSSLAQVVVLSLDEGLSLTALAAHQVASLDTWTDTLVGAVAEGVGA